MIRALAASRSISAALRGPCSTVRAAPAAAAQQTSTAAPRRSPYPVPRVRGDRPSTTPSATLNFLRKCPRCRRPHRSLWTYSIPGWVSFPARRQPLGRCSRLENASEQGILATPAARRGQRRYRAAGDGERSFLGCGLLYRRPCRWLGGRPRGRSLMSTATSPGNWWMTWWLGVSTELPQVIL